MTKAAEQTERRLVVTHDKDDRWIFTLDGEYLSEPVTMRFEVGEPVKATIHLADGYDLNLDSVFYEGK